MMKKRMWWTVGLCLMWLAGFGSVRPVDPLPTGPETWLELMGGNVRLDGLTKDLEAIKAAGISGVHLFHIFRPNGRMHPGSGEPMPCTGPKWEEMVRHVSDECQRLGLKLVLQNCPGWSQSGGPWIPPERAMRDLVFVRRDMNGGEKLTALPPVPEKHADRDSDWRDICVLAFPTPQGDETGDLKPVSKKGAGDEIVYRFAQPVTIRTMSLPRLHQWNSAYGYHTPWRRVSLEAKTPDGWKAVLSSPIPTTNWRDYVQDISFACDEATSDTWRYRIEHEFPFKRSFEPTFSAAARLTDWQAKAGRTLRSLMFEEPAKQPRSAWIDPARIVDITDKAEWTAPAGRWMVLRFGHVNAKYVNAPAPKEATGWECDKLDPAGIEAHFAGYVGKLADGALAGRLHGMMVDSWECWCQTWTAKMEDYYRAANGETLRPNLPALFGWIVGSPAETEAFLTRWRRTVGDLVTKNYYGRMAELAHGKGLACYYETAFGDIIYGDLLEYWKYSDAPMCEFWYPHASIDEGGCGSYDYKPIRPCASSAHIYGKRRVSAEAFTGNGIRWDEDFAKLQDVANRHFARGVTHLVFHCYTHQPSPDAMPPGNCMEGYNGTPFSRLQTWWKDMPEFTGFLTRCERLLEEGLPSQDVLWYLGDAVDHKPPEMYPFPEGFRADYLNHDVLTNRLSVKDGVFTIPEGATWKVLWVPETRFMLPATRRALNLLAAAGGRVVYGSKEKLVAALSGIEKDVATEPALGDEPSEDFMWIHRKAGGIDRYFVASGTNGYRGKVTFRAKGAAVVYDPVACTRRVWTNGGVLELPPSRSAFVEFGGNSMPTTSVPNAVAATERRRELKNFTLRFAPGWGAPDEVKLETPVSWTEMPGLTREAKAYPGTVTYETTFDVAEAPDGRLPVTRLDLGRVASQAKVFVNGHLVGLLWCAPYACDMTPFVTWGTNHLRIEVTNTWRNRVIYDLGQPEAARKTWIVNQPGFNPTADDPLVPAGLLGPVTLTSAQAAPEPEGWENVNPDRREFPPAKVIWAAPAGGFKVEREDGAEGDVTVSNGVVTIRKTNDSGRIVVSAPPFTAEKGRLIRLFADVEAYTERPHAAEGYVCAWSDVRKISPADALSPWGGFESGGETMRMLVNSAPRTPYRKYKHCRPESDTVTVAIVVAGAKSTSVWKNLAADDHEAAQIKWAEHFKRLHAPDRSGDLQDETAFDKGIEKDVDHTAQIEVRDGFSRFVVDGKVRAPIVYKSCEWNFDGRVTYAGKPLQEAGVRIGVVNLRLGDLNLPSFSGPWTKDGFDAKAAVRTIKDEMRVADKSLFILAIGTSAYPEFTENEHPDEVWIKEDGTVAYGNSGSVIPDRYNDGGKPDPGDRRWPWVSPASPAWRSAIKRVTAELFAELKRTGLMKRIVGVHYFGYHDGQFAMPILDHSPCAKAEYARYLKERGITERDPAGSFAYFSKQLGFRALEDFSREAKRLAGKPIVACKWEMSPFNISFDVTSFVHSDAVDIIVPQANYHKRFPALAQGLNAPAASFHRHGKMLWLEFDFRTWAALDQWEDSVVFTKGLNAAEDIEMWRTMIRKNAGMINACRMGWWLYDMAGGWYCPPEIVEDFKGVWSVRQGLDELTPDPWRPDVAFVVDELAMANYNTPQGPKVKDPVTLATLQWPRNALAAVPYETWLADDFYADPSLARRYKAVFLAGFVEPSAAQRELMAKMEAAGARLCVIPPGGLTAEAFHGFAKASGAFVAADPNVLEIDMNGDFLSVHCLVPGTHVVRLPFQAEAINLKTGTRETADLLTMSLTAGETRWYRLVRTSVER